MQVKRKPETIAGELIENERIPDPGAGPKTVAARAMSRAEPEFLTERKDSLVLEG
jgi:hypothetical protein